MTLRTIGFIVFKNLHDFVVVKKKGWMLYTAGLIVSHLQLLFVVVAVLNNHNKPRWLTCDPTWRACGEYITKTSRSLPETVRNKAITSSEP